MLRRFRSLLLSGYSKAARRYEKWRYRNKNILELQAGNDRIANTLIGNKPCAIGKIGSVELASISCFLKSQQIGDRDKVWRKNGVTLHVNAGVFPAQGAMFDKFCNTYLCALAKMTDLAIWFNVGESRIVKKYCSQAQLLPLRSLEPYYHSNPWSAALKGKKVLVVHPFIKTISQQYKKKDKIWSIEKDILPDFELYTIKSPLSDALIKSPYHDWFDALAYLKSQMELIDFDIAIIGAGAYSIPLAAHARDLGRIGIHLGGAAQILFGIRGNRWDHHEIISKFYNSEWCRPCNEETPQQANIVEDGCYW